MSHGKPAQRHPHTELPKSAFRWLEDEHTYPGPEGHRLHFTQMPTQPRADHTITLALYHCPAEPCLHGPRQRACTRTPPKGRSVRRMENAALLDAWRARMPTDAAKRLYPLRRQTVALHFADFKEHRGLRRFHGRGLRRATAEVGALVLAHHLLYVEAKRHRAARDRVANAEMTPTLCVT